MILRFSDVHSVAFDGEIHNGGFHQFFFNSPGDYAIELLDHLETIGAVKSRELLAKAVSLFTAATPAKNRQKRHEQLTKLDSPEVEVLLSNLDQQFWKYEDKLASRLNAFVKSAPERKGSHRKQMTVPSVAYP